MFSLRGRPILLPRVPCGTNWTELPWRYTAPCWSLEPLGPWLSCAWHGDPHWQQRQSCCFFGWRVGFPDLRSLIQIQIFGFTWCWEKESLMIKRPSILVHLCLLELLLGDHKLGSHHSFYDQQSFIMIPILDCSLPLYHWIYCSAMQYIHMQNIHMQSYAYIYI